MFETITRRDRPKAASQAAKTSMMMGIMLAKVRWEFRMVIAIVTKRDSIIPSRQSSDDIRWDRYISRPNSDTVKATAMLMKVRVI